MIAWVHPGAGFPPVEQALQEPNGLLAASAHLDTATLALAYTQGIFPWYSDDEPVLWWSPDPRMVLHTQELRLTRSLRKTLRQARAGAMGELRLDTDFEAVMHACAEPRSGQGGTWITPAVIQAYVGLHHEGCAHSIELWRNGSLVGGAYGVSLGRMFFGESMFARERDASKIALCTLVSLLRQEGVAMIDCQQKTAHLASLGAREIPRAAFMQHVQAARVRPAIPWPAYQAQALNPILDSLLTD